MEMGEDTSFMGEYKSAHSLRELTYRFETVFATFSVELPLLQVEVQGAIKFLNSFRENLSFAIVRTMFEWSGRSRIMCLIGAHSKVGLKMDPCA